MSIFFLLLLVMGLACCILEFTKYVQIRRCAVIAFVAYAIVVVIVVAMRIKWM